jgi:hypothetical protein
MKKFIIKPKKEPWEIEDDDLDLSDPNYEISRPYRIWHEYLWLSPTFALAIKEYNLKPFKLTDEELKRSDPSIRENLDVYKKLGPNALNDDELKLIPDDYTDVVKTFKIMAPGGWCFSPYRFKSWWNEHGADIFGYRINPSPVNLINIPHHSPVHTDQIIKSLYDYISVHRIKNANSGFALIAVPLTGNKKSIIASVSELIKNNKDFKPIIKPRETIVKLEKGMQLDKLAIGLRVLWIHALNPNLALWKVGLKAEITDNPKFTCINPDSPRQPEKYKDQISNLETMTSRKLREALIIMENAARGRFPCNDPNLLPLYNKDGEPLFDKDKMLEKIRLYLELKQSIEEFRKEIKNNASQN